MKKSKIEVVEKRFVIDVFNDKIHLSHLLNSDLSFKEYLNSYEIKIRELGEDETVMKV